MEDHVPEDESLTPDRPATGFTDGEPMAGEMAPGMPTYTEGT